jgi:hypothetical protein
LQFYDPVYAQIRVLDLAEDKVILVPTNQQAIGDGHRMGKSYCSHAPKAARLDCHMCACMKSTWHRGYPVIGGIRPWAGRFEFTVFSPDGETLVIALRGLAFSKQTTLVGIPGRQRQSAITDDERASFAAYTWDSSGRNPGFSTLAVGKFAIQTSGETWQPANDTFTVVAEDAAWPQWLR